jgi:hypothetical protein
MRRMTKEAIPQPGDVLRFVSRSKHGRRIIPVIFYSLPTRSHIPSYLYVDKTSLMFLLERFSDPAFDPVTDYACAYLKVFWMTKTENVLCYVIEDSIQVLWKNPNSNLT